jgi:hypothetical protein
MLYIDSIINKKHKIWNFNIFYISLHILKNSVMILGYIVTDRKLTNIDGFVEQVNDISLADPTKPILIVGWKKAKQDPRYESILDKQLDENVFWTFSKTESRSDFEDDLKNFYNIIISFFQLFFHNLYLLYPY